MKLEEKKHAWGWNISKVHENGNYATALIIPLTVVFLRLDVFANCLRYQSAHSVWDQICHAVAKPSSPAKDAVYQ